MKKILSRFFFLGTFLLSCMTAMAAPGLINEPAREISSISQGKRQLVVTVVDKNGPVPGANILIKGTSIGGNTNMDGKVTLEGVPDNSVLSVSFIGYVTQELPLADDQTSVKVVIQEDTQALDEVVVTGYSTQVKKDITGSVAVVKMDALKEIPVSNFAEALQGKAAGVTVLSGGGPLGETTIRVRGIGSVNGADPLIIVDGVQGVRINSINPNDIESMQVLKDASASAIYGAKGANGVIIITTKQGSRNEKAQVSYNGYFGVATMANNGYDLLNAWEAMEFQEEGQRNLLTHRGIVPAPHEQFGTIGPDGTGHLTMPYSIRPAGLTKEQVIERFGSLDAWRASYKDNGTNTWCLSAYYQMLEDGKSEKEARKGTDWYDEIVRNGFITDQQVSITGGGKKATYAVGLGYMNREGTIKESWFRRYSLRANTNFNVNEYFSIGQNTNMALMENSGERGRQSDDNAFSFTYEVQPWVPVYTIGGDYAGSVNAQGGRSESALAQVENGKDNRRRFFAMQTAVYAELRPLASLKEDLTFRTQFSARLFGSWDYWMNKRTIMSNKEGTNTNSFYEQANYFFNWQWTNTLTYRKTIAKDHSVNVVLGTEALKDGIGRWIQAYRTDYPFEDDPNTWVINNGSTANLGNSGSVNNRSTMFGIFGRVDYSYKGKYLATLTVRRDGSSKFSSRNRWGTFPSASIGWRISDENFMRWSGNWLSDLKIRAGYGTTGNSNIGAYNWAFQYGTGNNYLYAIDGTDSGAWQGFGVTNLGDLDAKWETAKMFNVGFDYSLFRHRLSGDFDYYVKNTSDMLIDANWSALAGNASYPSVNIGDMKNTGFDFNISWRDSFEDFNYNVGLNLSHYKNKITETGQDSGIFSSTRISNMNVMMKGHAIGMFHGYKTDGIYKSVEDVQNYKNDKGQSIIPYGADADNFNAKEYVGQFKVKDVNNDGKITAADRTFIGNPHPDLTGGFSLGMSWKGFDFSTYLMFSLGNDLYAMYKYFTYYGALQAAYAKDRRDKSWDPETNPNGTLPMWATSNGDSTLDIESNSSYIEDGSYLRMQTLTLGYTLPQNLVKKIKFEKVRFYAQVSNVFTLTKYSGLDPVVRYGGESSNDRMMGTDYGSYGMPRQFILGANITF